MDYKILSQFSILLFTIGIIEGSGNKIIAFPDYLNNSIVNSTKYRLDEFDDVMRYLDIPKERS